jgi:hypothetical protein
VIALIAGGTYFVTHRAPKIKEEGSIAQIGITCSLIVNAVNCRSGETLATVSAEASDKDHVPGAACKFGSRFTEDRG